MEQLVSAWTVLSTMTPPEYTAMRPYLANSSGFQSYQYRCIEFALGNKNAAMLQPHAHRSDLLAQVQAAYEAPSLYDVALQLLAREGMAVPAAAAARLDPALRGQRRREAGLDHRLPRPAQHWDLYQLGEKLADIEDAFRLWRFRH
jgi:tryptophan 2,3-dioxygenase